MKVKEFLKAVLQDMREGKSELHSKYRYEVANQIETIPFEMSESDWIYVFGFFFFVVIPLFSFLIH